MTRRWNGGITLDADSLQQIAELLDKKLDVRLKPIESTLKTIDDRLVRVEDNIGLTYEHVGQLTEKMTAVRNSTDYIKHKLTDHDEKLHLLNKKKG